MNQERVLEAINSYTGTLDSMQAVVAVFAEELGDNWTETVFDELSNIPDDAKNKLKHVFRYYGATAAWNEVQEYLSSDVLDVPAVTDRIPVLRQWLEFFKEPGEDAVNELEQKLSEQANAGNVSTTERTPKTVVVSEQEEWQPSERRIIESGKVLTSSAIESELKSKEVQEEPEIQEEPIPDTPEVFTVRKVMSEIELLKSVQSWLAARCISLNNIEIYAYPFYGFVVDLLRQVLKDMDSLDEKPENGQILDRLYPEGKAGFDKQKESVKGDIAMAEQNCESEVTALISDDMDMDSVRDALGAIDDSGTVEYLGPAPDGFEALDMSGPLDEKAIKEEYAKIEGQDVRADADDVSVSKTKRKQENASQESKNSVQRKLSFSLKTKKPTGGAT